LAWRGAAGRRTWGPEDDGLWLYNHVHDGYLSDDLLDNFVGNLNMPDHFPAHHFLYWVWPLNVNDALDWNRHVLHLANRNLPWDRHLHNLFDNLFHGIRHISVANDLMWNWNLVWLRYMNRVQSGPEGY
jgi:hypothetical protein